MDRRRPRPQDTDHDEYREPQSLLAEHRGRKNGHRRGFLFGHRMDLAAPSRTDKPSGTSPRIAATGDSSNRAGRRRTGKRRSATVIISRGVPGRSVFLVHSRNGPTDRPLCPPAWASVPATLRSHHVRPCPSLLRCRRDQACLLHPTASAYPEHRAQSERGCAGGNLFSRGDTKPRYYDCARAQNPSEIMCVKPPLRGQPCD